MESPFPINNEPVEHLTSIEEVNEKLEQELKEDAKWHCECNRLTGHALEGRVCPDCGTICQNPEKPYYAEPVKDKVMSPVNDYMTYEQYLRIMRETHGYEKFDAKQALEFDNAVTYRWRDIRALRLVLSAMESGKTNPLSRFTSEYRRVYSNMEFIYLEMANLRNFLSLEIENLREQAKRAKKDRKTFLSMALQATADRIQKYTAMGSRIPVSMDLQEANKLSVIYQRQTQAISEGLRDVVGSLRNWVTKLREYENPSLEVLEQITYLENLINTANDKLANTYTIGLGEENKE